MVATETERAITMVPTTTLYKYVSLVGHAAFVELSSGVPVGAAVLLATTTTALNDGEVDEDPEVVGDDELIAPYDLALAGARLGDTTLVDAGAVGVAVCSGQLSCIGEVVDASSVVGAAV